jgi:hypothetical protein
MALMEKPTSEITLWPPLKYKVAHRVTSVDNWWKVAERYGIADPWTLIYFNFATDNPLYVNYYLYKLVGCRTETQDHKNFRFSSADTPGMIYIPPDGWKPPGALDPDSELARRAVLNVLSDPTLARVSFVYKGYSVGWPMFIGVANRIIDRRIAVRFDQTKVDKGEAEYGPLENTIFIGFKEASGTSRRAIIVHECVHAGLDVKKASGLIVREAECAAYIAQAWYASEREPGLVLGDPSDAENQTWQQQIFDVSHQIAKGLKEGKSLGSLGLEVSALESAILHEPKYASTHTHPSGYDGV